MSEIHEIHGLSSLHRTGREGVDVSQEVLIRDRRGLIHLELGNPSFGAGLTPAAARYLAQQLTEAADRAERSEDKRARVAARKAAH